MLFEEYLKEKKIDPVKFQKGNPSQFKELKTLFDQLHPSSFTAQKLFLINPLRRQYKASESDATKSASKARVKPKIPPKRNV